MSAGLLACGDDEVTFSVAKVELFQSSETSVEAGETVTLSWKVSNASSILISAQPGGTAVKQGPELEGSVVSAALQRPTTFILTAKGKDADAVQVVTVDVSQAAAPVINDFTANPSAIPLGDSVTLSWDVSNAASVEITDSAGASVYSGEDSTGSEVVTPQRTEVYTLIATNTAGVPTNEAVLVTVNQPGAARVVSFSAAPQSVSLGGSSVLSWEVSAAPDGIRISADGVVLTTSMDPSGTLSVRPVQATQYDLVALSPLGNAAASTMVTVMPSGPAILSFDASPNPGGLGGYTMLSWEVLGAEQLRVERNGEVILDAAASEAGDGLRAYLPRATNSFTLTAVSSGGQSSETVVVTTQELPAIQSFSVTPLIFAGSTTASVSWSTAGATSVSLLANGRAVPGFSGAASGTESLSLSATTELTLVASNAFGDVTRTLVVLAEQPETEPNDNPGRATPVAGSAGAFTGEAGLGDVDLFAVRVPSGGWVSAEVDDGQGACLDTLQLVLVDPDGRTQRVRSGSAPGQSPCAIDPMVDAPARNLAGGTYYVVVLAQISQTYRVSIRSGGPACGNGLLETFEWCDDGNLLGGDGCDAACTFEPLGTVSGLDQDESFTGSLLRPEQADLYVVDLPAPGSIAAELYLPSAGQCQDLDPQYGPREVVIVLLDEHLGTLGQGMRRSPIPCAEIDPALDGFASLDAGTYYLAVVRMESSAPVPAYELHVRTLLPGCGNGVLDPGETCDDGNLDSGDGCDSTCAFEGGPETEPNDLFGDSGIQLVSIGGTGPAAAFSGSISSAQDRDLYAVEVPQGYRVEADLWVSGSPFCQQVPVPGEPLLELFGPNQPFPIATAFSSGGRCPQIDLVGAPGAVNLAAGEYHLAVTAPSGSSYFLFIRIVAPECGNAALEGNEQCDDGDLDDGDGCSSGCMLEIAQQVLPPGGSAVLDVPDLGAVVVEIVLDQDGQTITATITDELGAPCPPETEAVIFHPATGTSIPLSFNCTTDGYPVSAFTDLAAGSYYLVVQMRDPWVGPATLNLDVSIHDPGCGNRRVETRAGEQCDDGNTSSGDGCSDLCTFETLATYTAPGAPQVFAGAISSVGEVDVFEIVVTAPTYLEVETFGPTVADGCAQSIDTVITLFEQDGVTMIVSDDESGQNHCSKIASNSPRLEAGTYYLTVNDWQNNSVIPAYEIRFEGHEADICGNGIIEIANAEQCDDGNLDTGDGCDDSCQLEGSIVVEVEPNNSISSATPSGLSGAGMVTVSGAIGAIGDHDLFMFEVPVGSAGLTLDAQTYAVLGDPSAACGQQRDTKILLLDGAGAVIAENDDNPTAGQLCSRIDGSSPEFSAAASLAEGTYFIQVQHWNDGAVTLPYFMRIQLQ